MPHVSKKLYAIAQGEIDGVLSRLPEHLREAAQSVAIRLEKFPDPDSGLEEDLLGVFLGNSHTDIEGTQACATPTEIILFIENLWDYAEEDEAVFREEVRVTLVHELGHFYGLDEIDLEDRGLS